MNERIAIKPPTAIGDAVIATAHIDRLHEVGCERVGLITRPFIGPLWKNIEGAEVLSGDLGEDVRVYDVSRYLGGLREGVHLAELQAEELVKQGGPRIYSKRDDVRIILSTQELVEARDDLYERSGELPSVIISPESSVTSKNLPGSTVGEIVRGLEGRAVCYLMQSPEKPVPVEGLQTVWGSLRESTAKLAVAQAVIVADTSTLHMVNGAFQGSRHPMEELGLNTSPDQVIAVLGSSTESVVTYRGNRVVTCEADVCPNLGCFLHNYPGQKERFEQVYEVEVYDWVDGSGCVFPEHAEDGRTRCMEAITADEIIEQVLQALR